MPDVSLTIAVKDGRLSVVGPSDRELCLKLLADGFRAILSRKPKEEAERERELPLLAVPPELISELAIQRTN